MLFVALSGASRLFGSSFVGQYTPQAPNIVGDGRMNEWIPIPTQKKSQMSCIPHRLWFNHEQSPGAPGRLYP